MKPEDERKKEADHQQDMVAGVRDACSSCGICSEHCQFLKSTGTPGSLARAYLHQGVRDPVTPFHCSLCGLCSSVCPEQLQPGNMFLEMRRAAVRDGKGKFAEHHGLLNYERKGTSRRFSWYGLPGNCDTVFFPGCALPGTRPKQTIHVFELLQELYPELGVVLDCCTKPSHDLGRQDYFLAMFGEMKAYLEEQGVRQVIVACPNCYAVFRDYAPELVTTSVYELLAKGEKVSSERNSGKVVVHDPCSIRNAFPVQDAVRTLLVQAGLAVKESAHSRSKAFCCGEGGGVAALAPHFAAAWAESCIEEAAGSPLVTSCAGCANFLGSRTTAIHILDLLFDPDASLRGKAPVSRAPITYLNRLRVKRHFISRLPVAVSRERDFSLGGKCGRMSGRRLLNAALTGAGSLFSALYRCFSGRKTTATGDGQ